jgi:hypothetical protein
LAALSVDNLALVMIAQRLISIRSKERKVSMLGDGPEAGREAGPLALTEPLMPIGRSAFSAPSDAKLTRLDRDHEEKIPHRVGVYQLRERSLAMPLPVGHSIAEEAQRRLDPGQAAIGPARPAGLALSEAAAMVTRNFVAVHWLPSVPPPWM